MRRIAIFAALLACGLPALSQNIRQSVEVTNEYEAKFSDFQKLGADTQIPDSLYEFDYSFDYSVFDSPYRGSYEFTPYEIQITPDPMVYDGRRFMLRAGAGYSFRPVLDLWWTPVRTEKFTFGLSNTGRGYYGRYDARRYGAGETEVIPGFTGFDFTDSFEAGGRYLMKGAVLSFGAGYDGIFTSLDEDSASSLNSARVGARISSTAKSRAYFSYDLGLDYRFASDRLAMSMPLGESTAVPLTTVENNLKVYGSLGPVLGNKYSFLLDFDFQMESADKPAGYQDVTANFASLTPHVVFSLGGFDFDAGVNLDYLCSGASSFTLAPVVEVGVSLFSGSTRVFAGTEGGRSLLDVWSLKNFSHYHTPISVTPAAMREKFGAYAGIGGRIGRYLQYELRGGYGMFDDMPFEGLGGLDFGSAELVYAGLDFEWMSERLEVDGNLDWRHVLKHAADIDAFAPAALTADVRAEYNWMSRIYAGIGLNAATARRAWTSAPAAGDAAAQQVSAAPDVRGYADLRIFGEYRFNSRLGAWLELGNLLGSDIERHPGYVVSGQYFTVGATLNL